MRKTLKGLLIGFTVTALLVIVALPVVLPPIVESVAKAKIGEFGLKSSVRMSLGYCWRNGPGIEGGLDIALTDSPWRVTARFGASCSEWSAAVKMNETEFSESDPVIETLLAKYPVTAVSNLTFAGSIALDAKAERTFHTPVPVWTAKLPIRNLAVGLTISNESYSVSDFSVTPAASGIAGHVDIATMYPRAKAISAAGFELSGFHASVRVTDKDVLVTEATAGFCGGQVNLYSLFLDPKNLNTGFTLFVDDVNAGEALTHINGFSGEASGRLHGKIKLFVREGGKAIRLSDAFLYSTPGESGKLKLNDPTPVTDNLAMAGLDESTRSNVADALTDLDYSVLRLNLKRGEGRSATLSTTLRGTATRGNLSVPVDITLNFNGELEQLINTGLGYSNLLKGKQK
ncbi:MAG: YdbH domain-containing protein [bacterium]|nr:YdbH domain-containing protein [Candidatus Colisoma equi]